MAEGEAKAVCRKHTAPRASRNRRWEPAGRIRTLTSAVQRSQCEFFGFADPELFPDLARHGYGLLI